MLDVHLTKGRYQGSSNGGGKTMKNKQGKESLVVVGNGLAGIACVEEMLKLDPGRFEITVFGAERHLNYNRVLLSQVLTGHKTLQDICLHDQSWYKEKGIRLHTGSKVTGIKRKSRVVVTENGMEAGYNKLILATGAVPVIPRIPGVDKNGVVYFREMDDCEKIRGIIGRGGGKKAVIIGGGLLGLEAAYSIKTLGAGVTVVHLMDRLMERQLDAVSAGFLKEDIERLGIEVLLGKETAEILGDNGVEAVRLKDGATIAADMVVVSAGIRPNAELARVSGVYCEKGIVVSDTMQTYDPAIYAVGECVEHRGVTFGLVASVFEQARVLADHLAGSSRLVFKNKPLSAKLKIPGINLYSAGSVDDTEGADTIEYIDRRGRLYKKLIMGDNRIRGIILYGDTLDGPDLFSSLVEGTDISGKRHRLLSGNVIPGRDSASTDEMPDEAIVCGCNGVTKGMIKDAIVKKGLFTRDDVKRETKASSSCGGCAGLVDRILEATLGASFQGAPLSASLCGCTKYSRDDVIKNIKEKGLRSVKEVMEMLGWESVGCDVCRPAINYYIGMIWPSRAEDDLSSRLINERVHANIQKDGSFSVVPRVYGGVVEPVFLRKVADAAEKYGVPLVKLTGGQRIGLFGVKKEDLKNVWTEIGMPSGYAYGKALRTVKTCVGSPFCRYGTQDSLTLGIELEKRLEGLWMPAKVKMSVNGCPRNCAEAGIKDIGIVGVAGGFEVYLGGCGGIELRGAEHLTTVKTADEVFEVVFAVIQYYREDACYGERTFKWISRVGLKTVKKAVLDDIDNRKKLSSRLKEALLTVRDPWGQRTGLGVAAS